MTLKHLRELLNSLPHENEGMEIEVWLPGSRIALHGNLILPHKDKVVLIEGNLKPGSALEQS